jgi:chloramphenicol O-acetyltransferase
MVWSLANFIGNLPYLQLSSLTLHRALPEVGRPLFHLGQSYNVLDREYLPLAINFDHANADPFIINQLLTEFSRLCQTATGDATVG